MSTSRQRRGYAGVNKLRRTLRRLEPEATAGIKQVILRGSQAIEADMMINVPKDTGVTASHISYKISRDGLTAQIGFVGKRDVEQGFVARFIEYGTKGYKSIPPQPARPFMSPAFDANKGWISKDIRREISDTLLALTQEPDTDG